MISEKPFKSSINALVKLSSYHQDSFKREGTGYVGIYIPGVKKSWGGM